MRGANRAKRGYWVGGAPRQSTAESSETRTGGTKRKGSQGDPDDPRFPEAKTLRMDSPTPMDVANPSSSSSSDSEAEAELLHLPPSPPEALPIGLHTDMVHLIFPLGDVRVPVPLRTGFRPIHPYPFTGEVSGEDRERVRAALELTWVEEAARQRNPTVGSVSIMLQLRASWRWEQGWRLSRFSGEWIFMGDRDSEGFEGRLQREQEDRSQLRGVALRRLALMVREEELEAPVDSELAIRRMRTRLRELRAQNGPGVRGIAEGAINTMNVARFADRRGEDGRDRAATGPAVPQPGLGGQVTDRPQPQMMPAAADGARAAPAARPRGRGGSRPFPAWPWSRGRGGYSNRGQRRGHKRGTKSARRGVIPQDPWLELLGIMARHPEVFEWLHRVRTTQHLLMAAHPNRDHIRRVVESEERRSVELAGSLLRGQEVTGAATILDISWPPTNNTTILMGRPGIFMPGAELTDESDEETIQPPTPYCGPRGRGRGGYRGGRGGRGGNGIGAR